MSEHQLVLQRISAGQWRFSMTTHGYGRITGSIHVDAPPGMPFDAEKAAARDRIREFVTMLINAPEMVVNDPAATVIADLTVQAGAWS